MAVIFDFRDRFDDPAWSDVRIKVGIREYHCSKIVLSSSGSDYFKRLFDPKSKFKESTQDLIELKDDDPEAAEAMLHYLYGFGYGKDRQGGERRDKSLNFNINVGILAGKYLASNLAAEAMSALNRQISMASRLVRKPSENGGVAKVFDLIKALAAYGDHEWVRTRGETLLSAHLPDLMKTPTFRGWLETDGQWAMPLVLFAIAAGSRRKHEGTVCGSCGHARVGRSLSPGHETYNGGPLCTGGKASWRVEINLTDRGISVEDD